MQYLGDTSTGKLFIAYRKLKLNWLSCTLSGNPTSALECNEGESEGAEVQRGVGVGVGADAVGPWVWLSGVHAEFWKIPHRRFPAVTQVRANGPCSHLCGGHSSNT